MAQSLLIKWRVMLGVIGLISYWTGFGVNGTTGWRASVIYWWKLMISLSSSTLIPWNDLINAMGGPDLPCLLLQNQFHAWMNYLGCCLCWASEAPCLLSACWREAQYICPSLRSWRSRLCLHSCHTAAFFHSGGWPRLNKTVVGWLLSLPARTEGRVKCLKSWEVKIIGGVAPLSCGKAESMGFEKLGELGHSWTCSWPGMENPYSAKQDLSKVLDGPCKEIMMSEISCIFDHEAAEQNHTFATSWPI